MYEGHSLMLMTHISTLAECNFQNSPNKPLRDSTNFGYSLTLRTNLIKIDWMPQRPHPDRDREHQHHPHLLRRGVTALSFRNPASMSSRYSLTRQFTTGWPCTTWTYVWLTSKYEVSVIQLGNRAATVSAHPTTKHFAIVSTTDSSQGAWSPCIRHLPLIS